MPTEDTVTQDAGAMGTGILAPTPIALWRKPQEVKEDDTFLATCPSGNVVRMRRSLDFMTLVREGKIPNPLQNIVMKSIAERSDITASQFTEQPNIIFEMIDFADKVCCDVVIEPQMTQKPSAPKRTEGEPDEVWDARVQEWFAGVADWKPPEGYLCIEDDVHINDRFYIFQVALGGVTDLERFRGQQETALASIEHGTVIPVSPQRSDASRRPLPGVVPR